MKRAIDLSLDANPSPNKKIKLWSAADFLVPDTLRIILSKLDPKNQRHARLVCKQWFDIINISEFNIGALYRDELPSVISVLSRYDKPISVSFKNLHRIDTYHLYQLTRLTNITALKANVTGHQDFLTALTDLRSLTLPDHVEISSYLLTTLKSLRRLSCKGIIGEIIDVVSQLQDLSLKSGLDGRSCSKFPELTQLKAGFIDNEAIFSKLESLTLNFVGSDKSLPETLTHFDSSHFNDSFDGDFSRLTRLRSLIALNILEDFDISHFPFLEMCSVGVLSSEDNRTVTDMANLSHLTALKLRTARVITNDEISGLTRLTDLELNSEFDIEIDLTIYSTLTNLTRLRLDISLAERRN
eukprot:TRINITY_DN13711_c0_g1_i1.p1 TRINITY_DN13711_c0_g1~~TRINITY_DN13711_c0_g1_i1.p1  ORF type:complete len:356 (+),score=8.08 TRINITY_DN13711_c0_g1_i1:23-1090(+)